MIRQGDVLLVPVGEIPANAERITPDRKRGVVLAYGEVTGHAHVMAPAKVSQWDADGQRYVTVRADAPLTHEEHATHIVPAGKYRVVIHREYSPEAIRNVAD